MKCCKVLGRATSKENENNCKNKVIAKSAGLQLATYLHIFNTELRNQKLSNCFVLWLAKALDTITHSF